MSTLLDQASSLLIGGSILLLLMVTMGRSQQSALEETALYHAKKQNLEFADFIEQELRLLGTNVPEGSGLVNITAPRTVLPEDDIVVTDSLSFSYADTSGTVLNVDYVLSPVDTLNTDGGSVVLFELQRFVNGNYAGGSPSTLRSFHIELFSQTGTSVGTNVSAARLIRVTAVNSLPFNTEGRFYMEQTYWGITVRPASL